MLGPPLTWCSESALGDTGACICCVNFNFVIKHRLPVFPLARNSLVSACGKELDVLGGVRIVLDFGGGNVFVHTFVVLRNLQQEMIIGRDFLCANELSVSVEGYTGGRTTNVCNRLCSVCACAPGAIASGDTVVSSCRVHSVFDPSSFYVLGDRTAADNGVTIDACYVTPRPPPISPHCFFSTPGFSFVLPSGGVDSAPACVGLGPVTSQPAPETTATPHEPAATPPPQLAATDPVCSVCTVAVGTNPRCREEHRKGRRHQRLEGEAQLLQDAVSALCPVGDDAVPTASQVYDLLQEAHGVAHRCPQTMRRWLIKRGHEVAASHTEWFHHSCAACQRVNHRSHHHMRSTHLPIPDNATGGWSLDYLTLPDSMQIVILTSRVSRHMLLAPISACSGAEVIWRCIEDRLLDDPIYNGGGGGDDGVDLRVQWSTQTRTPATPTGWKVSSRGEGWSFSPPSPTHTAMGRRRRRATS